MEELTERQRAVLAFIVQHIQENRYPPTVREIGAALEIRSTNGVSDHLKALERKGYLAREGMKSRALIPTPAAWAAVGEAVDEAHFDAPAPERRPASPANDELLEIPLLGRVAAGQPILAEESCERTIRIDPALATGGKGRQALFALRVQGDSMIGDGILDGDTVIVRQQVTAAPGEMVVAMIEGEATVKRYHPEGNRIRLQPSNPALEPIYVSAEEARSTSILGKVIGLYRAYPH